MNSSNHPYIAKFMQMVICVIILAVAVANISACSNPTTTFPISENFESNGFVYWTQDAGDDFDWITHSGSTTSSSTGPNGAYSGTYYAYTEATDPNNPNKVANLISPCFQVPSGVSTAISFAYHMYGSGMGSFDLDITTNDGANWVNIWNRSGDQGTSWHTQEVNLSAYVGQNVKLRFRVVTNTYQSDVSIDNVEIFTSTTGEICDDGIDNDNDGLIDEYDPDCGVVCYNDCETAYQFTWFDGAGSGSVWEITNGQNSLTRVYPISGSQGTYNVSVTLDNSDGQNIDFANCGTQGAGSHFYTATCNDPNGTADCDGDPNTSDSQFTYGCDFLTFGITADNSDQKTSITYEFEYPAQICNMLIGDIDHQGWAFSSLESWQDEVEVVAHNNGVPVAINAIVGSKVNVFNNNTDSLVLVSQYNGTTSGDLYHTDPDGHATITSLDKVTSIKFTYSNGPDDDGPSDDHAIRINGFEFCPEEKTEICNNEIDDDEDGLIDCEDIDCGMLDNIEFKDGSANWNLTTTGGASGTFVIDNTGQLSGNNSVKIVINSISGIEDLFQFSQGGASVENGKTYRVYFQAKSSTSRDIQVEVQTDGPPDKTCFIQDVPVANFAGEYVYEFTADSDQSGINLIFNLGQEVGTVWLDRIQLKEVCPDPACVLPVDDNFVVCGDEDFSGSVAGNDNVEVNGFNTTYQITTPPSQGSVVMEEDGSFVYTANPGAIGNDAFGYERCYSFKNDVGLSNLIYNPCGDGLIIETFTEGIEGESSPSVQITNPSDMTRVMVEVWAESACGSVTIEGQNATAYDLYRSNGSIDTEKLYRVELTSVSADGLIDIVGSSGCVLSSAAAYVERQQGNGQGSSSLLASDFDLYYSYVGGDDCMVNSMPIGKTDGARDITFTIPIHEKDNVRTVEATITAGSVTETASTTSWTTIGQGAGEIELTLSGVSGDVEVATIKVCSPDGNGDSFGVGIISATSLVCTAEPTFDCCADATASVFITRASVSNSSPNLCVGSGFSTLSASDNSASSSYTYAWSHSSETTAQVHVSPLVTTTYTVTVTNGEGCISTAETTVNINPDLEVDIEFGGTLCLEDDSQLTALVTGGSGPYGYSWTGPNSFTATTEIINVAESGNYSVTVTDALGCTGEYSAYVYEEYTPFIFALNTEICEGEDVTLSINSGSAVQFNWDANANNATTSSVTVTPQPPSTTYTVTVTNDQGCSAEASATIDVVSRPVVSITGPSPICIGETSTLSPSSGGTWISTNSAVATVTDGGLVTGISAGSVNFIFTDTASLCESLPTADFTVDDRPSVEVTGPTVICEGFTTELSPTTGGSWASNDESIAIVSDAGIVTGVSAGSTSFEFTSDLTGCVSNATQPITVNSIPTVNITGPSTICVGENTTLTPATGGTWSSSNTTIATVGNGGVVIGINAGTATFTFTSNEGCVSSPSAPITVEAEEVVTVSGQPILCEGETTVLTASTSGGTWSSSNNSIALVDANGEVTAVATGSAIITYDLGSDMCATSPNFGVQIIDKPTVSITGATSLCVGESTLLSTTGSGGFWTSSDTDVAIVSSSGIVVGTGPGSVSFTYTSSNGCASESTGIITVDPNVDVYVDFNGSLCLTDDSQLSAIASGGTLNYSYEWTGPGGFASTDQTIDIELNGNYNITVTDDKGCSSNTTAFVYEAYEPFIFALNTDVCEGEEVTLSVSSASVASYQWSENAGSATTQSVTVTPGVPSTTYHVTVTNDIGCTTEATAVINVKPSPDISISGDTTICQNETTQLSPTSGGIWTSSDYDVAIVSNTGLVTGVSGGTATFVFRSDSTGCYSDPSDPITVINNEAVSISGDDQICMGESHTLTASTGGGIWSSSNVGVVQVSSSGELTPIIQGNATITYTIPGENCYAEATFDVTVHESPSLSINGSSTFCEGDVTYLSASTSGEWTSSDPSIASVSGVGIVTGHSAGTVTMTFESTVGCVSTLGTPITVIGSPEISLDGPADICINSTTSLLPSSGGIWMSSNTNVATVSSSGIVTGISPGMAMFTFIEYTYGCASTNSISITVNEDPSINGLADSELCIGDHTTITPATGGTWTSSNPEVATIDDTGFITAISAGTSKFVFTNTLTGCSSNASAPITINSDPETSFNGPTTVCVGETTSISPSSGGMWTSSDVSIATISSSGEITAVSPGTVHFIFTNNDTGCSSSPSEELTVDQPTGIQVDGPTNICVGLTTSLSPAGGGTWYSSDENIATITNDGVVTGVAPGTVTFTYNSNTGCSSNASTEITIDAKPDVEYDGEASLCVGSALQLSPSEGGEWTSSNTLVASVDNNGLVMGLAPGTAEFTFVDNVTGCSATTESALNVYGIPVISIAGDDEICMGSTTNMLPSTGGNWVSSDPTIATISPSGVVTGINEGTVTFTFHETGSGCISNASDPVTILPKPVVSITGDNILCEGETTTLSPTSGGVWTSNNEDVATVTDDGIVTSHMQGLVKFIFISYEGCASNETSPVVVFGTPSIVLEGSNVLCPGELGQMQPSTGGTWTSTNPAVASINDSGQFTAKNPGTVRFIYTDSTSGCISEESEEITISDSPSIEITGPDTICIGGVSQLVPTIGGIWTSINPEVASIQNNGQVLGLTAGTARFIFTDLNTGCVSDTSAILTVDSGPAISFTGPQELCIGFTSNIIPASGGSWMSTDESVATIDDAGLITAVGQGIVKFVYTDGTTGCNSEQSESLIVSGIPSVSVAGPSILCIDGNTTLTPSTGGTWTSLQPEIAVVDDSGVVTGVAAGTAYFVFTDAVSGCESDGNLNLTVQDGIEIEITGSDQICVGYTTTLSPSTGGIWTSSNPEIASVNNSGVVTGRAPGVVTFEFIDVATGCASSAPSEPITVGLCTNHDFNVTLADMEIQGNLNTNDNVPAGTSYSNAPILESKPLGGLANLTIHADGTYSFSADKEGKYLYRVPVCIPPAVAGCSGTYLEINVVDHIYSQSNIVANLEFATTYAHSDPTQDGITIGVNAPSNDACINVSMCEVDTSSVVVSGGSNHGSTTVLANGEIFYTPNPGYIGNDTIYYTICEDGVASNCNTSLQVITVNDVSALNSTVAADDFAYTLKETAVSGNVIVNDSDPEDDNISVVAQGDESNPIAISEGEYYIDTDGSFTFIPADDFVGAAEIVYSLCDNNVNQACTDATIHFLVFDDISIKVRVYLEGALMQNGNTFSSFTGLPLMRDDLRVSPFTGENYIPASDPYTFEHDPYVNTPLQFLKLGPGLLSKNLTILDSAAVFSVTGDNAIVDWVHVELRSKDDYTLPIATRSGLLQRDGDVVDLDGVSDLRFDGISADSFYVVVKHRSHLAVMSNVVVYDQLVDFTDPEFPVFNFTTELDENFDYTGLSQNANVVSGYTALWAGDFDSNGKVKFTNPGDDVNILFLDVLFSSPDFLINYNNAIGYYTGDYNMNSKAKYTNPDDDVNYLFSQVLLYPLNTGFLSNFNGLVEQVPE